MMFLTRSAQPSRLFGRGGLAHWATLAVALVLTVLAWHFVKTNIEQQARARFDARVNDIDTQIRGRMVAYAKVLHGGVGLFNASGRVTRQTWRSYVETIKIEKSYPGIQGIGFARTIAPHELESHIAEVRAEGFAEYNVRPAGDRPIYTSIIYLEPFSGRNLRAFGYDMFSEPVRRAAMEHARDTGATAISGRVTLVQESNEGVQHGFLMYVPVYRHGLAVDNAEERRRALYGYVYSPFRMGDLMRGILGREFADVSLTIHDGTGVGADTLMFHERAAHHESEERRDKPATASAPGSEPAFRTSRQIDIDGRVWTMTVESLPYALAVPDNKLPIITLVAGFVISLLLYFIVASSVTMRAKATALAEQMTQEMRRSEARKRAILEGVGDGIVSVDGQGRMWASNPAAERIFGYDKAGLLGRQVHELVAVSLRPEFSNFFRELGSCTATDPQTRRQEFLGQRSDGMAVPIELTLSEGSIDGERNYIVIIRDITERKRVDRMKNEFVSTVSHELRTPLTSISGALGLVNGGVVGEIPQKAKAMIEIAHTNSLRLIRLINDILDIEKIESGKLEFKFETLRVDHLIRQAVEANASFGIPLGISFEVVAPLATACIRVDGDRFMRIMTNLMSNAAKFAPRGSVVSVRANQSDMRVRIEVSDRGPGIPIEFRARIFQKFSQADSSSTRQKGGTGLGLAITKSLVERMSGTIGFESELGVGTTFYFELPVLDTETPIESVSLPAPASEVARILVIEDDSDIGRILKLSIENFGFAVDLAADAAEAKQLLANNRYAAATVDIMLPGQDGLSLVKELRTRPATRGLPIIIVSACAREAQQVAGSTFSVVDWLDKPFDAMRLREALQRAVPGRPLGALPSVLHVEDDPDIRETIDLALGDVVRVSHAPNLRTAAQLLAQEKYSAVLLDLALPDGEGWDLLPQIQALEPSPPVIVFSAREVDRGDAQRVAAIMTKSLDSAGDLRKQILALIYSGAEAEARLRSAVHNDSHA